MVTDVGVVFSSRGEAESLLLFVDSLQSALSCASDGVPPDAVTLARRALDEASAFIPDAVAFLGTADAPCGPPCGPL